MLVAMVAWSEVVGAWMMLAAANAGAEPPSAAEPTAVAEDPDDPLVRARKLYDSGEARFATADYLRAIDDWTEAFKIVPDSEDAGRIKALLIYNIATARERAYEITGDASHLRQAKVLLEDYARSIPALFGETPAAADERSKLTERLNAITRAIEAADRKAKRDRTPAATDDGPDDDVEARKGGRKALIATGAAALVVGVGGLGMMAGGLAMGSNANDLDGLAPDDIEGRRSQFDKGRTGNTLAIAGGVVGGVFTIAGAVLVGVGASRKSARGVSFTPSFGRRFAGVGLSGRF
jgi:tetratricopeptide (TPR) repeat protein